MPNLLSRYTHWLHTCWPAGQVEKLPVVQPDGSTNMPGLYVVGDLTGVPLLKFAADSGAKAVRTIVEDAAFLALRDAGGGDQVYDLVIVGGGVSGFAAALEAEQKRLTYKLVEAAEPFSTLINFPKAKPIYTFPTGMTPAGKLQFTTDVKEALVDEMRAQTLERGIQPLHARVEAVRRRGSLLAVILTEGDTMLARRVIIAIGRSGNYRRLGVAGEHYDKVTNRLHDPADYAGKSVLVVGGGDSALETAIAVAEHGARVTLSYRKGDFNRPKSDNVERLNALLVDHGEAAGLGVTRRETIANISSPGDSPSSDSPDDVEAGAELPPPGRIALRLQSQVKEILERHVVLVETDARDVMQTAVRREIRLPNDAVLTMIGREPPLDFLRRCGIAISGEWRRRTWFAFAGFFLFCIALYHWKSFSPVKSWVDGQGLFPATMTTVMGGLFAAAQHPANLLGTLALTMRDPAFYYSLVYTLCIGYFGWRRVQRRRTPYVRRQTITLFVIQMIPLFLLPFIVLPWLGHNGAFGTRYTVRILTPGQRAWDVPKDPAGMTQEEALESQVATIFPDWQRPMLRPGALGSGTPEVYDAGLPEADQWQRKATVDQRHGIVQVTDWSRPDSWLASQFFPPADYDANGREYWRASGIILAWPLFVWNVFTGQPNWLWLAISLVQTFVIIPFIVWKWGKGAYCGWICSCGALAETMGDEHRQKMPHGPGWNRLNMLGQVFLASAFVLLGLRIVSWIWRDGVVDRWFWKLFHDLPVLNYSYIVDLWWAGIIGVACYFWFSGRVWCRFACPLAALMHIYARFSRFRIFAEKKKCISCNVCTTVCHQGIDVMSFANQGLPMADPQCVRCSACVQSCPTGVLTFGEIDPRTGELLKFDLLAASPVQMREAAAKATAANRV